MVTALSVIGSLLMLLGIWQGYEAVMFDTAIDGTVNLALMQAQTLTFAFAATSFLAGCIFMVGACAIHAFRPAEF